MTTQTSQVPFPLFLALWNRMQNQGTPRVHLKIARWLESRWMTGDTRLLLMAFRSCGKSTIVGLFAAWLLWRHPALRILVLAADSNLAAKMVRNTRRIIERHPLTSGLRPDHPDQWASDRFTVRRDAEWRDPSMIAFGIGANITGSRADVILCDDVEVPNTCDTPEKRENLRDRLSELSFVLVPGGTQLYVGTPHAFNTIYRTVLNTTSEADEAFLDGYEALRVPLLDARGKSAWPERFTKADVVRLRKSGGPRRFAAQMMLEPQPIIDSRLPVESLQWYETALDYSEAQGRAILQISDVRMVSASAWWDPAFGRGGDGSVLAVLFADGAGQYWLHDVVYLKIDPASNLDEATQQCRAVCAICRDYHLPSVTLEINGIGRFLPGILRREMAGAAAVLEATNRRAKDLRIIEAFDAVLAARALHVHKRVAATPFVEEMRNWRPGMASARDDGLDAVAGALAQQPVRFGTGFAARMPARWQTGADTHTAKINFNVME